ncbi:MAG TPA: hypothetical protein VMG40_06695 [Bryobacteraceae bacterium]|nr:hypothetical protein [Bryobacteraceae bacterium]
MPRAKWIVVLVVALAFAQLQCVAACVGDSCAPDSKSTPCHEHGDSSDRAPAPCQDRVVIAPSTAPHSHSILSRLMTLAVFDGEPSSFGTGMFAGRTEARSLRPPEFPRLPSAVLRI